MSLKNIRLSHIGFAVRDIEYTIQWYSKVLGFSKLLAPGICKMDIMGHKGFRCIIQNPAGLSLELEQRTDVPFPNGKSPIISHFSLEVDDIQAMQNHLKKHNIIPQNENCIVDKGIVKILYFTGLDDIRIELIQHLK